MTRCTAPAMRSIRQIRQYTSREETMAFKVNERDIRFVLYEQLGIEKLFETEKFGEVAKDDVDMILDAAVKIAVELVAPINKSCDHPGAQFVDGKVVMPDDVKKVYNEFSEAMWNGVTMSPEYGGLGLPMTVNLAANECFMGASTGFHLTSQLTAAAAGVIYDFYEGPHKQEILENMSMGTWAGTMCLTEPSAGSDVGALKTTAKKTDGDTYLIEGPKIFISAGDHDMTENIVHLVLARLEGAPQGPRGISLFVVTKYKLDDAGATTDQWNDAACVRIEEKMGIHGSPTAQLSFGDDGNCEGWLIGEENQGLRYMFKMMNEERVNVGIQGVCCGSAAYLEALDYAKERLQFTSMKEYKNPDAPRCAIIEHPDVRRMLMYMKTYTEGMRSLLLTVGLYEDLAMSLPDADERAKYQDLVELLTPVCKSYCTDIGFKVCEMAVQVLGGYGYCQEYPVEQYLRDEKIASIYEGTNGIQQLDLLTRKLGAKNGALFTQYMEQIGSFIADNKDHATLGEHIAVLNSAKDTLIDVTRFVGAKAKEKALDYAFLQAAPYMDMFGHVAVYQLLIDQALIAEKKLAEMCTEKGVDNTPDAIRAKAEGDDEFKFYMGKIDSVAFFASYVMPQMSALEKMIKSGDRSALDVVL